MRARRLPLVAGPRGAYAIQAFLGQLVFAVLAFVGSVLAARLLGVEDKGEYTAWTLAGWITAITLAGPIPVGMGRINLRGDHGPLAPTALKHAALVTPIAAALALGGYVLGFELVPLIAFAIAVPAWLIAQDLLVVMQALKRPWTYQAIRITGAAIVTIGMLLLTVVRPAESLYWALAFFSLGGLAAAAVSIRAAPRPATDRPPPSLLELAERGRGSTVASVIDPLLLRADQFIVLPLTGASGLGIYSVGINWSEVGLYVGHSIGQSVFEDQRSLDHAALGRIIIKTGWILSAVMGVIAISGWFLIAPIFGEDFQEARWVVIALAPGVVARGLGYSVGQALLARGEGSFVSRVLGISLAAGVVCWLTATALWGIVGAAAASTAIYGLQCVGLSHRALRTAPNPTRRTHM